MTNKPLIKLLDNISSKGIFLLTLLLPLFFLPITTDFFDYNKKFLLILVTAILVLLWIARSIYTKSVRLTLTSYLTPLVLITLVSFVSVFMASTNKIQGIYDRPALFLALTFIYLLITTRVTKARELNSIITALTISGSLLGLVAVVVFTGAISAILPSAPEFLKAKTYTPAGSPLSLILYLVPVFFLALTNSISKHTRIIKRSLYSLAAILIALGIGMTVLTITQKDSQLILLPFGTSWEIAVENFKDAKTALIGQGPESFVDAFTLAKPSTFNNSPHWNLRFSVSRNEPFHLLTTVGLFGFLLYLWLIVKVFKNTKSSLKISSPASKERSLTLALIVTIALQLLYPQAALNHFLLVLLLALQQTQQKLEASTKIRDITLKLFAVSMVRPDDFSAKTGQSEILPWVIGAPLGIAILAGVYFSFFNIYSAETTFKKSLDAASQNQGTETYNLQINAIQKNPREDRYRTAYALTNLALANSIASKEGISDSDRQNITQLIQQAIREGKFATQLNPRRTSNWESLSQVYRNLVNVAQGAQEWAVASLVEAIKTDPNNPQLRLALGGIYFGIGDHAQAARFFSQATLLKPDWSNAHYNLSAAYREQGLIPQAIDEMQLVLQFVEPSSADYAVAQQELKALNSQLGQETVAPPAETELTEPEPLPTPAPEKEQIELPEDSGPDTATGSATPTE